MMKTRSECPQRTQSVSEQRGKKKKEILFTNWKMNEWNVSVEDKCEQYC